MIKRVAKPIEKEIEDELEDIEDVFEEDDEDDVEYEDSRSRLIPSLVLLGAFGAFVALGWYAYQAASTPTSEELVLVEAEDTPIKEKPLDAGGMQFPHQDKSVFETIAGGAANTAEQAEVITSSEEPISMAADAPAVAATPAAPAVEATEQALAATPAPSSETIAVAEEVNEVPVATVASAAPEKPAEKAAETSAAPAPATVKEATPQAPAPAKAATTTVAAGNQTVQLGAFKSEADAENAWKKISGNPALAGTSHNIQRADLGAKGVFYRLRVSGVDATKTCASLGSAIPCMVVK